MVKRCTLRILSTGLFVLSIAVSCLTFATVASAGEEAACPKCNTVELNCPGSTCTCQWGFAAGYKCVP
jgi:hypothetical protein